MYFCVLLGIIAMSRNLCYVLSIMKGGIFMKLNHDCVRDFMLYLEDNLELDDSIESYGLANILKDYAPDEVVYSISKLVEAGYISGISVKTLASGPSYIITTITWSGHKFIDNVRTPQVWTETKQLTSKFGAVSIDIISQVAASVISKALGI